jgi:hypothetical protein
MKFKIHLIPVTIALFAGCATKENNKKIIGKWVGTEWLVNSVASSLKAVKAFFVFNEKGIYSFEYSGSKEEGTYKVENDMLFTKPANQHEIMVKIFKLTKDSLVFDMNRSGQLERLTLRRN